MFAAEHYGIEPDLVTTAKSLAAGMPLSSVTGRAELMDSVHVGGLGGTYGGNPVSCAAALAAIAEIEERDLCARARVLGERLRERLGALAERSPHVGEVRGLGAMVAVELVEDRASRAPAKALTSRLMQRCAERGVILIHAGTFGNILRFLLPLVIEDAELEEGLDVIESEILAA
jgi:4-aminobutyrate aminotransferase/(S)-3-amino-2-methylpropionate transaminase